MVKTTVDAPPVPASTPPHESSHATAATDSGAGGPTAPLQEWRRKMQTARIQNRWSIADLADHIKSDHESLAGFERGDMVLAGDSLRRLREALSLPPLP